MLSTFATIQRLSRTRSAHPSGGPSLKEFVGPGRTVAIVVDDPSRWTPVSTSLPLLIDLLLNSGVRESDISISAGVGRHAAVDAQSMSLRVGPAIAEKYPCHSPPVDDLSAYDELGTTPEGVPVRVFKPVARADIRILIGSVLPHLQAGFGGGYKLIFPGCSHRSTLGALHRQGLEGDNASRLLGSDPSTNPMRTAIRHAAALLPGPCFSLSHLMGPPGTILEIACGDPDAVQQTLSEAARHRFQAPVAPYADVLIAGNSPWPGDPMQSFKVLLHHQNATLPGAALVGFFWTDPDELARSFPVRSLRAISATGRPGGWFIKRGLALADHAASSLQSSASFMIRWARELVVDRHILVYAPALRTRSGPNLGPVRLHHDQNELWADLASRLPTTLPVSPRLPPRWAHLRLTTIKFGVRRSISPKFPRLLFFPHPPMRYD